MPSIGLGAIIKPHDHEPGLLSFATPVNGVALPTSLDDPSIPDKRLWTPGIGLNQGDRPYCVGYAGKQYLSGEPVPRDSKAPPAPTTIYRYCNRHDGEPQPHEGSTVHALATYFGLRRLVDANIAFDTDLMQAAIWVGARSDAVCGINWYRSFDQPDAEGIVRIGNSELRGGHAIHVCGVWRSRAMFILQQSWGDWPTLQQSPRRLGPGLFMIPFDDMARLLREDGEFMAALETA